MRLANVLAPRDREFFDLFEEAAGNIVRAAGLLKEMLNDYPDKADLEESLAAVDCDFCLVVGTPLKLPFQRTDAPHPLFSGLS